MHDWNLGWFMWWPMWPLGAGVAVVLVWVLVRVVRSLEVASPQTPRESPEDIVKRRYAEGALDHDTFERMLSDLREPPAHPA